MKTTYELLVEKYEALELEPWERLEHLSTLYTVYQMCEISEHYVLAKMRREAL